MKYQILKKDAPDDEWQRPTTEEEKAALIMDEEGLKQFVNSLPLNGFIMCDSYNDSAVFVTGLADDQGKIVGKLFITYEEVK